MPRFASTMKEWPMHTQLPDEKSNATSTAPVFPGVRKGKQFLIRRCGLRWEVYIEHNGKEESTKLFFWTEMRALACSNRLFEAYLDGGDLQRARSQDYLNYQHEFEIHQDRLMAEPWIEQINPKYLQLVEEATEEGPVLLLRATLSNNGEGKCIDIVVQENSCLRLAQQLLAKVRPR